MSLWTPFIQELPMEMDARLSRPDNIKEVSFEKAKLFIDKDISEGRLLNVKEWVEKKEYDPISNVCNEGRSVITQSLQQ